MDKKIKYIALGALIIVLCLLVCFFISNFNIGIIPSIEKTKDRITVTIIPYFSVTKAPIYGANMRAI